MKTCFNIITFKKSGASWVLFNFAVLAFLGALLRYMHCFFVPSVNYQFLLHAHSHFAFSGWMFLAIILLFFHHFKKDRHLFQKQFNLIFALTLLISFGMLVSFFLTGYKVISIIFSTLFVFISYWFVLVVSRTDTLGKPAQSAVSVLLKGALFFLVLSSVGPFALGYLKSTGLNDLILQQNAIYFYLHFQLNGFMQLALLGFLFKSYFNPTYIFNKTTVVWTKILVLSTLPLYSMFMLWGKPAFWVYILAFISAALHFIAWCVLLYHTKTGVKPLSFLAKTAIFAVSLQFFFQLLVTIPLVGSWVFDNRNLIVGYVHLLTLGSLSPIIIDLFARARFIQRSKNLNLAFVLATVGYLLLLFGSSLLALFKIIIPNLEFYLFLINMLFPVIGIAYFVNSTFYQKNNWVFKENRICLSNNI